MVMELIRATSPMGGFYIWAVRYSADPFSPINHYSLFLKSTLNVVKEP